MNTSIVTYKGRSFDYLDISSASIHLEDIAHSLSMICRYGGHTSKFYSVAEHCVRASRICLCDPLAALLHDAGEAYLGDIPSPQKKYMGWRDVTFRPFSRVEDITLCRIGECLHIPRLLDRINSAEVKHADRIMMATEIRDLMPQHASYGTWCSDLQPLSEHIEPLEHSEAEKLFLKTYYDLT